MANQTTHGPAGRVVQMTRKAARGVNRIRQRTAETMGAIGDGAMRTTGELTDLVADVAENTLTFNPLIGIRRRDMATAAGALLKGVASAPRVASRHLGAYVGELRKVVRGDSEIKPDPKDRRFVDPAWQSNFLYRRLMQAHALTQRSLDDFIDQSSLDARNKGRAHFLPRWWPTLSRRAIFRSPTRLPRARSSIPAVRTWSRGSGTSCTTCATTTCCRSRWT